MGCVRGMCITITPPRDAYQLVLSFWDTLVSPVVHRNKFALPCFGATCGSLMRSKDQLVAAWYRWWSEHPWNISCIHTYIHACMNAYIHQFIHPSIHPSIHTYIHTYIQCAWHKRKRYNYNVVAPFSCVSNHSNKETTNRQANKQINKQTNKHTYIHTCIHGMGITKTNSDNHVKSVVKAQRPPQGSLLWVYCSGRPMTSRCGFNL